VTITPQLRCTASLRAVAPPSSAPGPETVWVPHRAGAVAAAAAAWRAWPAGCVADGAAAPNGVQLQKALVGAPQHLVVDAAKVNPKT
jgi:hypothetical protein